MELAFGCQRFFLLKQSTEGSLVCIHVRERKLPKFEKIVWCIRKGSIKPMLEVLGVLAN